MNTFASDEAFRKVFEILTDLVEQEAATKRGANADSLALAAEFFRTQLEFGSDQTRTAAESLVRSAKLGDADAVLRVRDRLLGLWTVRDDWAGASGYITGKISHVFAQDFTYHHTDSSTSGFVSSGPLYQVSGSMGPVSSSDVGIYLPETPGPNRNGFGAWVFLANGRDIRPISCERKRGAYQLNGREATAPPGAWR